MNSSRKLDIQKLIEQFIIFFIILFSVNSILTQIALQFNFLFSVVSKMSFLFTTTLLLFFLVHLYFYFFKSKNFFYQNRLYLISILGLSSLSGLISFTSHFPDGDESFYIANAIYYIEHPFEKMNFALHQFSKFDSGQFISYRFALMSTTNEFFWSYLSSLLNLNYLDLYQGVSSALFGFLIALVAFYIFFVFSKNIKTVIVSSLVYIALIVLNRKIDDGTLWTDQYLRIWTSKGILYYFIIPLYFPIAYKYFKTLNFRYLSLLFLTTALATGLSTSAYYLIPIVYFTISLTYLMNQLLFFRKLTKIHIQTLFLFNSSFIYLFFVLLTMRNHIVFIKNNISLAGGNGQKFNYLENFNLFFTNNHSFTFTIFILSLILVLFKKTHIKNNYLTYFSCIVFLLILINPFTSNFISQNITSPITYNRIFMTVPFLIFISLHLAKLITLRLRRSIKLNRLLISMALIFFISFTMNKNQLLKDNSAQNIFGNKNLHFNFSKINKNLQTNILDICKYAPPGNMISDDLFATLVPMFTSKYPQTFSWMPATLILYGSANNELNEATERFFSFKFLYYNNEDSKKYFIIRLQKDIQSVVLNTNRNRTNVTEILEKYHFKLTHQNSDFDLYTKNQ